MARRYRHAPPRRNPRKRNFVIERPGAPLAPVRPRNALSNPATPEGAAGARETQDIPKKSTHGMARKERRTPTIAAISRIAA